MSEQITDMVLPEFMEKYAPGAAKVLVEAWREDPCSEFWRGYTIKRLLTGSCADVLRLRGVGKKSFYAYIDALERLGIDIPKTHYDTSEPIGETRAERKARLAPIKQRQEIERLEGLVKRTAANLAQYRRRLASLKRSTLSSAKGPSA